MLHLFINKNAKMPVSQLENQFTANENMHGNVDIQFAAINLFFE